MNNINATNFRKDVFTYLNQTIKFNEPINISTKNGNAILISEEEYNSMVETLYIESVPGLKDKILKASKEPASERKSLKGKTLEEIADEL